MSFGSVFGAVPFVLVPSVIAQPAHDFARLCGTDLRDDPFLFAADTAGKLYAADQRTGKVMYQYNGEFASARSVWRMQEQKC